MRLASKVIPRPTTLGCCLSSIEAQMKAMAEWKPILVPPATAHMPGLRVGLRQNGFADLDVFLRECSFLS